MSKKGNVITGFLFFLMACIIVALFMPTLLENLNPGTEVCSFTNGIIVCMIIQFMPLAIGILLIIIFLIIMRQ